MPVSYDGIPRHCDVIILLRILVLNNQRPRISSVFKKCNRSPSIRGVFLRLQGQILFFFEYLSATIHFSGIEKNLSNLA